MKQSNLGYFVLAAVIAGIVVGYVCNRSLGPDQTEAVAANFGLLSTTFLRMIKMIIAPLVFTGIVAGIASFGDAGDVRRVGLRAFGWFISASLVSLLIGLALSNAAQLGVGVVLPPPAPDAPPVDTTAFSLANFITHVIPSSIVKSMAENDVLSILVFAVFFGLAASAIRPSLSQALINVIEDAFAVMLKVTGYVMWFTPFGVFGAVASVITLQGLAPLTTYAKFLGTVYLGMLLLWAILFVAAYLVLGRSVFRLLGLMRTPLIVGFATCSGEAAYPKILEQMTRFGVAPRITNLILPLAYSFNLDGMMMYLAFAVVFIAQAAGIELSFWQQFTMLLVMMITSKGVAGVPRAAIVVIGATLPVFGLPIEGVALLLAIDQFVDMGRTATNVFGNCIAAAVIAKWEGALDPTASQDQPEAIPADPLARPVA